MPKTDKMLEPGGYWQVGRKKIKKRYGYHKTPFGNIKKHQYKWDQGLGVNRYKRRQKQDRKLAKKSLTQKRR